MSTKHVKLLQMERDEIIKLYKGSVTKIAEQFKVSRPTIYNLTRKVQYLKNF